MYGIRETFKKKRYSMRKEGGKERRKEGKREGRKEGRKEGKKEGKERERERTEATCASSFTRATWAWAIKLSSRFFTTSRLAITYRELVEAACSSA